VTDPAISFGSAADAYQRSRPEYPAEAVNWLLPDGPRRVADVGAGTGKLTGILQAAGHDVVAVDPDPQMLAALAAAHPGVPTLVGTAEAIPLPDASVDAVTFGQAWHWVDPPRASVEVARVVRPGGVLGLFWNIRDDRIDWVRELTEIMHSSPAETMIANDEVVVTAPFGPLERAEFEWVNPFSVDGLVELVQSRSYVITATSERRAQILDGVRALGGRVADASGMISMPYRTEVFRARVAG
jgi:SAM-dependent methyltransferase